jgi:ribosomal protein S7
MKKNSNLIKYEVTPKVLEAHAGLVNVTIKGTFPANYFDKKTTVTATPVMSYNGKETAFDNVQVLQGESVQANNKVVTYSGGNFTYTSSVPYEEAMKISELEQCVISVDVLSASEKTTDFSSWDTKEQGIIVEQGIDSIKPRIEVRPRRIGGSVYQVPTPVKSRRQDSLAIRWLVTAARAKANKQFHTFGEKIADEIILALKSEGSAVGRKQEIERMAEANKAFAHLRW